MPATPLTPADRAAGALLGALAGDRGRADAALRLILARELAEGRTDLRALVERWVESRREEGGELDAETAAALDFLAAHHAPPPEGAGGSGALARTIPVALVAARSPRNLVSATFHIAALTHPAPESAWGAVAVNVAAARLLQGRRDFVPDVLEALTANAAPEPLLAAVRRVPLERWEGVPSPPAAASAAPGVEVALWLAHREPVLERGLARLRGGPYPPAVAAAAAALMGARDGPGALPGGAPEEAAMWSDLAARLIRMLSQPTLNPEPDEPT